MKQYLFLLVLALGAVSCVSTRIESNKVSGFDKKAARIYLKINTSKESKELMMSLGSELKLMLGKRGIQVKSGKVAELDLGEDAVKVQEEMALFQPDLILSIGMNARNSNWIYTPNSGGMYSQSTRLSTTLGTFPLDQPVWKGVIRTSSTMPGLGAHNIAKKLVGRLERDGLLAKPVAK